MRYTAIRLLTLAVCATAMACIATTSAAEANRRHIRRHHHAADLLRGPVRDSWAAGEIRTIVPPVQRAGTACPGNARAIDCTVWPPPIDEDPDRKATSSDGG
jgi:hypothetical protein